MTSLGKLSLIFLNLGKLGMRFCDTLTIEEQLNMWDNFRAHEIKKKIR